jgi:hypothetical protein
MQNPSSDKGKGLSGEKRLRPERDYTLAPLQGKYAHNSKYRKNLKHGMFLPAFDETQGDDASTVQRTNNRNSDIRNPFGPGSEDHPGALAWPSLPVEGGFTGT